MIINWRKYPSFAPILEREPRESAVWSELHALIAELEEWCACGEALQSVGGAMLCPICDSELYRELRQTLER